MVKTAMGLTNTSWLGSDMKPKEINPMPDKRTDESMRVFRVRFNFFLPVELNCFLIRPTTISYLFICYITIQQTCTCYLILLTNGKFTVCTEQVINVQVI